MKHARRWTSLDSHTISSLLDDESSAHAPVSRAGSLASDGGSPALRRDRLPKHGIYGHEELAKLSHETDEWQLAFDRVEMLE